jgi:hypothetical protein
MSHFTPAQLDDLDTQAEHLIGQMRRILTNDHATDLRALADNLCAVIVTYGRGGFTHLVRNWLDQVVQSVPGAAVGRPAEVMFTNPTFTGIARPEHLAAEHRWVADAISAHLSGRAGALEQLTDTVPSGSSATIHLLRALEVTTAMLLAADTPGDQPFRPGLYYVTPVC